VSVRDDNHVDFQRDEFGDQARVSLLPAVGETTFDDEVLSLGVSVLAQPCAEDLPERIA